MTGGFRLHTLFARLSQIDHVAVAVSGGSDSVSLMHLVADWCSGQERAPTVSVLSVDHGLRPQSQMETRQVSTWAKDLGFCHATLAWTGEKPKTALQSRARQARYDLMTHWCQRNGVPLIMTAHTMDDQAETVVMRMARSTTPASLAGVWKECEWNGIAVYRPLLGLRRVALRDYLQARGQGWIDDPSNEEERFERVRVRRALVAGDQDRVPELAGKAACSASMVSEVDSAAQQWSSRHVSWKPEGYAVVDRNAFTILPGEVQSRILCLLLMALAGSQAAPAAVSSLAEWVKAGGASRRSLGGVLFALRKASFVVGREAGRISSAASILPQSGGLLWDHRFWVTGKPGSVVGPSRGLPSPLAPPAPVPRFVRDGWPVVQDALGQPVAAHVTFKPRLR